MFQDFSLTYFKSNIIVLYDLLRKFVRVDYVFDYIHSLGFPCDGIPWWSHKWPSNKSPLNVLLALHFALVSCVRFSHEQASELSNRCHVSGVAISFFRSFPAILHKPFAVNHALVAVLELGFSQ